MSVSRARASPYVVSRRLGRRAISRALAARRQPRSSRAPLLATFFAAAPGGGHAGTTPLRTTMAPPGAEHHSHLPELTGIEYARPPRARSTSPLPTPKGTASPRERVISSRRSCRDFSPPPAVSSTSTRSPRCAGPRRASPPPKNPPTSSVTPAPPAEPPRRRDGSTAHALRRGLPRRRR